METLHFDEAYRDESLHNSHQVHFNTKLSFLNAHNGLRRGSIHTVLGTAGGGKSTLIRTILRDFIFNKQNQGLTVSVWLSEETCKEYKIQLMHGMPASEELKRGVMISEEEYLDESLDFFIRKQELICPDIIIYDNLTTSRFYDSADTKEQNSVFRKIKTMTKKINCATIVVCHTGAEVSDSMDRLINMNDVRGSKSIINGSEFVYILQRFEISETGENRFFPTIRITKHRGQELVHNMYFLQYMKELRAFVSDSAIQFEKFKEAYGLRKKLK